MRGTAISNLSGIGMSIGMKYFIIYFDKLVLMGLYIQLKVIALK